MNVIPLLLLGQRLANPLAPHLDLDCALDPEHASMHISCTVTYPVEQKPMSKAVFFLADQMQVPKVRLADGGVEITPKELSKQGHDVTYEVSLPKDNPAGRALRLQFDYSSKEPKGFVYLLSSRECLAGGYNTCWFPSVGSSRRMLGTLRFDSPAGYVVKATGKESGATDHDGRLRTSFDLLQPLVPTFAAARFSVVRIEGKVPTTIYLLKPRPVAKAYADGCAKILTVLTKEFGPYPFPDFSIIETPSPESSRDLGFSGASFEGFMFEDSDSVEGGFNNAYFGHEMGHQWWGNLVQTRGAKGTYMLSEAMAQLGSLQCVREIDGPVLAAKYRYSGYPAYSSRQCARGALLYGPAGADRPMSAMPPAYDVAYHQLANSKGFLVWDTIARQVGRDRFRKALHAITSKYAWSALTFDQALDEIRKAAGRNVDGVLAQWLDRTGAPVLWPDWRQEGKSLRLTLHQSAPAYELSLPVVVGFGDGSKRVFELPLSSLRRDFDLSVGGQVASVEVDPNWEVFHSTPSLEAEMTDLKNYGIGLLLRIRGKNAEAAEAYKKGLLEVPNPDTHAVAFLLHFGLGSTYLQLGKAADARDELLAAIRCPTRTAEDLPWVYFRLATALKQLKDTDGCDKALRDAESAERALGYPTGVAPQIEELRRG